MVADFRKIIPMHPKQYRFAFGSPRRNQLNIGGAGSGKTVGLIASLWELFAANPPGVMHLLAGRTGPDLQHTLLPEFFRQEAAISRAVGVPSLIRSHNKLHSRFDLIDGSVMIYKPYDQIDKIRGPNLGGALVDEIEQSRVNRAYAFRVFTGRVRDPRARIWRLKFATTPNGPGGVTGIFMKAWEEEADLLELKATRALVDCNRVKRCEECETCRLRKAQNFTIVHATLDDNVFLPADVRSAMKAGMSARMYAQEVEGKILMPRDVVFLEYRETPLHDPRTGLTQPSHLIDWKWDPKLPYALGIDWGTSHAYMCVVQIKRDGTWIVCDEVVLKDISHGQMRTAIRDYVQSRGKAPIWIAADRAVKAQNIWVKSQFPEVKLATMRTREEQSIISGIEGIRSMLEPWDGSPPRLFVAKSLRSNPMSMDDRGIRDSLKLYEYETVNGERTNTPSRSPVDPNKHAIDALRYLVHSSRLQDHMHGGSHLPYASRMVEDMDYQQAA